MKANRLAKRHKLRGHSTKAQLSDLADVVVETTRLWRRHHLSYDQTKYIVEQARRLEPPKTRRRSVDRLDKSEIERLIKSSYEAHSKYGLMIKTLFLTGTRVDEFIHIKVEDLHLNGDPPQIRITHAKGQASRYVPILPSLAQELRTHLQGREQGYLFESNRNGRYSARSMQAVVKDMALAAGITKRVYGHRVPSWLRTRAATCPSRETIENIHAASFFFDHGPTDQGRDRVRRASGLLGNHADEESKAIVDALVELARLPNNSPELKTKAEIVRLKISDDWKCLDAEMHQEFHRDLPPIR